MRGELCVERWQVVSLNHDNLLRVWQNLKKRNRLHRFMTAQYHDDGIKSVTLISFGFE